MRRPAFLRERQLQHVLPVLGEGGAKEWGLFILSRPRFVGFLYRRFLRSSSFIFGGMTLQSTVDLHQYFFNFFLFNIQGRKARVGNGQKKKNPVSWLSQALQYLSFDITCAFIQQHCFSARLFLAEGEDIPIPPVSMLPPRYVVTRGERRADGWTGARPNHEKARSFQHEQTSPPACLSTNERCTSSVVISSSA